MRPRGHVYNMRMYIVQLKNGYIFLFFVIVISPIGNNELEIIYTPRVASIMHHFTKFNNKISNKNVAYWYVMFARENTKRQQ